MEAIIHLKGQSEDIVRFAQLILQAAKLFRTEAELGSKSKDDWDVIFERQSCSEWSMISDGRS